VFGRLKEQPSPQSLVSGAGSTTAAVDPQQSGSAEGPRESVILLVFFVLTLAATAYVLAKAEHKALHDPVAKAQRGEVHGLSSGSFLRPENFKRALDKVSSSSRPFITNVRVAPERVDATVRDQDGSRKLLNIDLAFKVTEYDNNVGDDPAVRASQIDTAAPQRMVKAMAERTGLSTDAVDYVTMSIDDQGPQTWFMSLKDGFGGATQNDWIAEADGSDLRHPGDLSRKMREEQAKIKRDTEREQRRISRILEKRSACLSKAITAERASRCIERYQP
jgi:hypothetical protein